MAIATAGDIGTKALQLLGVYGAGQTLTDSDAQLMLDLLNAMMDEWSNYTQACFEINEQSVTLVPGQNQYTIGPGGNINGTRPLKILTDPGTAYILDGNGNKYPMQVVPRDKWNLYSNTSSIITSDFPDVLFYDPQMPLGVINISPFPNTAYTMYFDSMLQFSNFASIGTALSLPPGYNIAMFSNLAVIAKPFFLDGQMDPEIAGMAMRTLGAIKRTNQRELYALYDSEIVARGSLSYNPYTDSVGSTVPAS